MAQGQYMAPPGGMSMQNPAAESIVSLLGVVRILALIFGILLFIGFLGTLALAAVTFGFGLIFAIPLLIFFLIDFFIYTRMGAIRDQVRAGQLREAKSRTLLWMILGFILGGVIVGIILLLAYIKFDEAITWQQQNQMAQPAWGQPAMGQPMQPGAAPAPAQAPAAQTAPICPKCNRPATWIAQYNRWYCMTDQQYL